MILDKEIIRKNIVEVKEDILKFSPNPENVKLIAVTKYFGPEAIEILSELGVEDVGENRGQSIRDKINYFQEKYPEKSINWHFIGNLQKNKVKYIIEEVSLIHSINSLSLAKEIDKRAKGVERCIDGLLEINISGEESKEGYRLEKLLEEIPEYLKMENLKIKGLMTMAPDTDDEEVVRKVFSNLRSTMDFLNREYFHGTLLELSMGMSGDYKIALEEGATLIRVGTKLYEK